ncbi:ribosome recycling factor [Gemmatimonadota bacterium]
MVDLIIEDAKDRMSKAVSVTQEELSKLRTGKATPALVEHVKVEAYGSKVPMNQVATISTPDATLLVVNPYDKSLIGPIERAIMDADLGLNPSNDGQILRVPVPHLSEERRKELVKVAHRYAEEGRIAIRNVRRDANDHLKKSQKDGEISEDELHRALDRVQEVTNLEIKRVDDLLENKETEIMAT